MGNFREWILKPNTELESCIPSKLRSLTSNPSNIRVQLVALLALFQYYDSPMRCFTFKDFQLAPTLEEYERLLGFPLAKGHYPSSALVAKMLMVLELEIVKKRRNRNDLEGIQRIYLEERLHQLL
ncbi:hypothetical protein CR513_15750, partial [Mucuna pruriens]